MDLSKTAQNNVLVFSLVTVVLLLWLRWKASQREGFDSWTTSANLALRHGHYRTEQGFAPTASNLTIRGQERDDAGWAP